MEINAQIEAPRGGEIIYSPPLNARSIINKKTELNIMVDDIKPHIIGITESWANNDITDAELGLEGYVMFRKDRMGRRGGGVLLFIYFFIYIYYVIFTQEYPISAQHCSPWGSCITCMTKQTSISIHSVIIQ